MPDLSPPIREIPLQRFGGLVTFADPRDIPGGASPMCNDVTFLVEGVQIRPGTSVVSSGSNGSRYFFFYPPPGAQTPEMIQEGAALVAPTSATSVALISGTRVLGDPAFAGSFIAGAANPGAPWIGSGDPWRVTPQGNFRQLGPSGPAAGPSITEASTAYIPVSIQQPYPAQTCYSIIAGVPLNDTNAPPPSNVLTFLGDVNDATFGQGVQAGDYIYAAGFGTASLGGLTIDGTYPVIGTGVYTGRYGTQHYIQVRNDISAGTFNGPFTGATVQKTLAIVSINPPLPAAGLVFANSISIGGVNTGADPPFAWNRAWPVVSTPSFYQLQITSTGAVTADISQYAYTAVTGMGPAPQQGFMPDGYTVVDSNNNNHCWSVVVAGTSTNSGFSFPASPTANETYTANGVTFMYQEGLELFATVFNTTHLNGAFNVQNVPVLGTPFGAQSFNLASSLSTGSLADIGYALVGSGSVVTIDPGAQTAGTGHPGNNPIYGSFNAGPTSPARVSIQTPDLAPGQRYAVLLWEAEDGSLSPASPPAEFYTTGTTRTLNVGNVSGSGFGGILTGPPGTVARIIAITAAGTGIGGPYFYIPNDVFLPASANTLGQSYTISATRIADNTTTSATLTLTDAVLLAATNISEVGNNYQQTRPIQPFAKALLDSGRMFYLGEQAAVTTLVNCDFAGGSAGATNSIPGWTYNAGTTGAYAAFTIGSSASRMSLTMAASGGTLNPNETGLPNATGIYQTLGTTAFLTPVLEPATPYSVRVVCSASNPADGSSLVVQALAANGNAIRTFTIPSSSMPATAANAAGAEFSGPIIELGDATAANLLIYPAALPTGDSINVLRCELYPTAQPANVNQLAASYAGDLGAVDAVTGVVDCSYFTQDPLTNVYRFLAQLFVTTATRTYHVVTDAASEPAEWVIREISNRAGCGGPMAQDAGEEFSISANQNGVYVFDGGDHLRISQEIQQLWNTVINHHLTWVKVDLPHQRILVGCCLPTPNQWLPNAPANAAPSSPNVILACSYYGVVNGRELGAEDPLTVSMFTGDLLFREMRRKWTIWQIPSYYAASSHGSPEEIYLGNDNGTSPNVNAVMKLDETVFTDNGAAIPQSYTTAAFPDAMANQQLQLGWHRKQYSYCTMICEGAGSVTVLPIPETLNNTLPALSQPAFPLANPALDDLNVPLNVAGNRMFLTVAASGTGSWFRLRQIVVGAQQSPRVTVKGQ